MATREGIGAFVVLAVATLALGLLPDPGDAKAFRLDQRVGARP